MIKYIEATHELSEVVIFLKCYLRHQLVVSKNVQLTFYSYLDSPPITTDRAGANGYWTKPSEYNCMLVMVQCLQITGALWSVYGVV